MNGSRRRVLGVIAIALAVAACTPASAGRSWTFPPVPSIEPAPAVPAASAAPAATQAPAASVAPAATAAVGGDVLGTLEITAVDLGFQPTNLTVDAPGTYAFALKNTGTIVHDVTFPDGTTITAQAGETATGSVAIPAEGISFLCSIPGHADAGMKGSVTVKGSAATSSSDSHGGPAPALDIQPDPAAPAPVRYDPTAPAVLDGDVHDIDLVIEEKTMTVATGFVVGVWTFGGTVPGPAIRVHLGDLVRIHLKNPITSKLPHSVDFHSSLVAWNGPMTSINPGEEKLYEFRAKYAGVWMYHCGTAPALHHIANGMYGMMIVEPKGGLEPLENEYALVQSEWYLGEQGQPVSLTKAAAGAPSPDFLVFNGVADQYKDGPIEIPVGKRIRVFLLDAGPNIDSSFHIVGTIFSRVIKEGVELSPDNAGGWGSQAVDLSPAQGAIVEFEMADDGLYPIVTHAFNFVGRGALGLFKAGDGEPKNPQQ
ncbi:MAG: multicopper oxidase domain-containing protein [Chloroflexi bacterium]|jgi:nitrite reductase (NO-forming)|nr:multicopper oxidase domain-containing protein [Chloroflexota bacterium]